MQNVFWDIIKKFEKIAFKYKVTGLKTPTSRRHPVSYLQAWPRISTLDDREQIQLASGQSVTRTRDRGIASVARWPLGHAAVIVSNRKTVEGTVKKNENETYRLLGHNAFIFFLPCSMLWSRADNKKNKLLKQLSEATTNCKPRDCKGQLQPSLIFNCVNAHNLLYYCWITFFCLRHLYRLVKTKRSFLSQNTFIAIIRKEM